MATKKVLKDVPEDKLQEVIESLLKKGAKIVEVKKQDDGLFTIIYELPDDDSDDNGGGGDEVPDSFDEFDNLPMSDEGGSRDFP